MESPVKRLLGEYETLKQRRDNLKLQAHLFSAEVKKQWSNLEKDWNIVVRNVKEMGPVLSKGKEDLSRDTEPLIQELRNAYERIKSQIDEATRQH